MFDAYYDSEEQKLQYERHYEEHHYSRFFESALEALLKQFDISKSELEKSIDSMLKIYDYSSKNRFSEIDFTRFQNLCAYFLRFGPLSAGLTRHRVLEAVSKCDEFKSSLQNLRGSKNSVVSIGGGPGCDIVGFCSGVHGIIDCNQLDLTVVDIVEGWGAFFDLMVGMARGGFEDYNRTTKFRFQDMFRQMDIRETFLWQDASSVEEGNEDYSKVLKTADVVLMKSLLSVLPKAAAFTVAANVSFSMKEGSILLFLDKIDFDFCQLGLEKIYSSACEPRKDHLYQLRVYNDYSIFPNKCDSFSNDTLTIYIKRT